MCNSPLSIGGDLFCVTENAILANGVFLGFPTAYPGYAAAFTIRMP